MRSWPELKSEVQLTKPLRCFWSCFFFFLFKLPYIFFFSFARMQNLIVHCFQQQQRNHKWIHLETWIASPSLAGRLGKVGRNGRPRVFFAQLKWNPRERVRFPPCRCGP